MSVTVRLWSREDLEKVRQGKDKLLATIFMNCNSFSEEEATYYPYGLRRTFECEWVDEPEPITVFATDVKTLKQFLELEYTRLPEFVNEKITRFINITL